MARRILTIVGTRPEAIKMAPVVLALQSCAGLDSKFCVTGQHRQMLDDVLKTFSIVPDFDLNLMTEKQDPIQLLVGALTAIRDVLTRHRPDLVLVHGDTTTSLAAALAAYHERIPFAHVEAGLRTGHLCAPFPEEGNRALVSRLASQHFAPTPGARDNLLAEGVPASLIKVTGNTVVDALKLTLEKNKKTPGSKWVESFGPSLYEAILSHRERLILVTCHRRETFGTDLESVCQAIRELANGHRDWRFLYPVHLNPQAKGPVHEILNGLDNVSLLEPLSYAPFVWLMSQVDLIITDSGGIQEEAPSLGKPLLAIREVTERSEAILSGSARLIGVDPKGIVAAAEETLLDDRVYRQMARVCHPFGDGIAAGRIRAALLDEALPDFVPQSNLVQA